MMLGAIVDKITNSFKGAPADSASADLARAVAATAAAKAAAAGAIEAARAGVRLGDGPEFAAAARRTAAARKRLAALDLDEEILRRAAGTRGRLQADATAAIDRALGRAPADPEHDPDLRRLADELAAIKAAGTVAIERLRRVTLAGMGRGEAAEEALAARPAALAAIEELGKRQREAQAAYTSREALLRDRQRAVQRQAIEAKPVRLAELHRRFRDRAAEFDTAIGAVANLMHADDADRAEAAQLLGVNAASGFFATAGFRNRAMGAAARALAIDTGRPLEPDNNLLGVGSPYRDARSRLSLAEHTASAIAAALPFFDTRPEAEQAADRLDAAGDPRIVAPIAGVFMLVEARCSFADRSEAAAAAQMAAMRGLKLVVVALDPVGFVVIPADLAAD